jgi:hypothetical protein
MLVAGLTGAAGAQAYAMLNAEARESVDGPRAYCLQGLLEFPFFRFLFRSQLSRYRKT